MNEPKDEATINELKRLILRSFQEDDVAPLAELEELHPADIADVLEELDEDGRRESLLHLDDATLAEAITEVVPEKRAEMLRLLSEERLREILSLLPPDDAVDILALLSEEEVKKILEKLKSSKAEELRQLSRYRSDTAGGVMTTEILSLPDDVTIGQAIEQIQTHPSTKNTGGVFLVDKDGKFKGFVSAFQLLVSSPDEKVSDIVKEPGPVVSVDTDCEDVARLFDKYDVAVLPVVDEDDRLVGAVTFDDAIDVIRRETSEDMYRISGTMAVNPMKENTLKRAVYRLPFLAVTLAGQVGVVLIAKKFELTLQSAITLAFFIPVVNGMGGNVGLQAAMVVVRGIALGEMHMQRLLKVMLRELSVGVMIGIICAMVAFLVALAVGTEPIVPYAVGLSMFIGVTIAAVTGISVPLLFWRLGVDPAISAGPLITTMNDILCLTTYLSIATLLLMLGD